MKALKVFFLAREFREKLLILAFIGTGLVIWISAFSHRARLFWIETKNAKSTLTSQANWLAKEGSIVGRSQAAVAKLDPAKTYNENRLFAAVTQLGRDAFGTKLGRVQSDPTQNAGQFAINSVSTSITAANTEADWEQLKKLYVELQKLAPYINLKRFVIQITGARNGVGGTMTVQLAATSIEMNRPAR